MATITLQAQVITVKNLENEPRRIAALVAPGTGLAIHRSRRLPGERPDWTLTHVASGFCVTDHYPTSFKHARAMLAAVVSKLDFNVDLKTLKKRYSSEKKRLATRKVLSDAFYATA